MTENEIAGFITGILGPYIEARITAGDHPDDARRIAQEQTDLLFPGGSPAPGQLVYWVVDDDGTTVGSLWIGPHTPTRPEFYWVWDVAIDEAHQGRGLGRAAMALAEQAARGHGATALGLNVHGHNVVARNLYQSMGYETTALQMRKALDL
jgi:ribosomal protein S18 acetylase RimI-like enzyme